MRTRDRWVDSWTVVLCNPDSNMVQHNFLLSKYAAARLGRNRAEHDAKEFANTFEDFANVLYCGPTRSIPGHLKQEIAEHHHCETLEAIRKKRA